MVFDRQVPDLLPEHWSTRGLVGLGNDGLGDFAPVALAAHVLTLDAELVLEALDQACDLEARLHNLLCSHRHPLVLPLLALLQVVVADFSSAVTARRLPADNTGVLCGADDERLLRDARFVWETESEVL